MPTPPKKGSTAKKDFYKISIPAEKVGSLFYPEYFIISQTVDSVNNFNALYKAGRSGTKGGPSTHAQQDLYRAMLVFACAGLDAFVKKLVAEKLSSLISVNKEVELKFMEHVRKDLKEEKLLNTLAFALINHSPREVFLVKYIESMTSDSLQSAAELARVSNASGLDTKKIFSKSKQASLTEAFSVRHEIVHEMDINSEDNVPRTSGHRNRRQRVATQMEKHTKTILQLAEDLLSAYKAQYEKFQIGIEKKSS